MQYPHSVWYKIKPLGTATSHGPMNELRNGMFTSILRQLLVYGLNILNDTKKLN